MAHRPLVYLSAAAAAVYLLSQHWQPYPASALVKGCAVGPLALLAWWSRGRHRDAGLLALGLAFSTLGDVLLDLGSGFFAAGLGAFLLTHLAYISLFIRNRTRQDQPRAGQIVSVIALVAASIALSVWIVPSVGSLQIPVIAYICALTAMVCSAILAGFGNPWISLGAFLFMLSDSLLAVNKFKTPVPARDFLVWTTYYLGQLSIALGFLAAVARGESRSTAAV